MGSIIGFEDDVVSLCWIVSCVSQPILFVLCARQPIVFVICYKINEKEDKTNIHEMPTKTDEKRMSKITHEWTKMRNGQKRDFGQTK